MSILTVFEEWRERRHQIRIRQIAQSLRPHNTPQWFHLGLYLREWFLYFPKANELVYNDTGVLLEDIKARFRDNDYQYEEFDKMLRAHYRTLEDTGIAFDRADVFAHYTQANGWVEVDLAKDYYPQLKQQLYETKTTMDAQRR